VPPTLLARRRGDRVSSLFLSSVNRAVGIHGQPCPEVSRPVRPQRAVSSEP
jgi:hypothetical protein